MQYGNTKERIDIRNVLKKARTEKGVTQKDAANYLKMALNNYQRIEYGLNGTSEENWIKIFDLFERKVPLHELMENI